MAANASRLLRWYPSAWRERYGDDLALYMQDRFEGEQPPVRARLSLVVGGLRERSRQSGLTGDSVPPADRARAGMLVVLCSWCAFVIAGSNFAKLSEHFDQALPKVTELHRLPDLAYTTIRIGAAVAGIAVLAGGLMAMPAFVRSLRAGSWAAIKPWALSATGLSTVDVALFVPLLAWAHHLNDSQRNGGSAGYEALFLTWAAFAAASLAAWTGVAVVAGRRVAFSSRLLAAEAELAIVVSAAMVVVLAAVGAWWAALAERAPLFLSSHPSTPANGRLIATAVMMVFSVACAMGGVGRVGRTWRLWRSV